MAKMLQGKTMGVTSAELLRPHLEKALKELSRMTPPQLRLERYKKFRGMGEFRR